MYVNDGGAGKDTTTIDREHARLVYEGYVFLANGCLKNKSEYSSYHEKLGFEVHVCETAYSRNGRLLQDMFSIWGINCKCALTIPGSMVKVLNRRAAAEGKTVEALILAILEPACARMVRLETAQKLPE